jgi:uncharacterized protein
MTLERFFRENPKAALGFSGGVDSSYLLYAAKQAGADVKAYYIKTAFQPEFELEDARRLAEDVGAEITILEADVFTNAEALKNGPDRCYHCKQALFGMLQARAAADGYPVLMDGTNASDDAGDRPGMRVLEKLGVRSPLRECGITKAQVRNRSKEAGLFTWDKPAYACLATRVPTGTPITANALSKIERAEDALFQLGFTDFRARMLDGAARLQFPPNQLEKALQLREEILRRLSHDFTAVLLDLQPRT